MLSIPGRMTRLESSVGSFLYIGKDVQKYIARTVLGMRNDVLCYAVKGIRVIMEENTYDSGGD